MSYQAALYMLMYAHRHAPHASCSHTGIPNALLIPLKSLDVLCAVAVLQAWQLYIGVDLAVKTWPAVMNKEGWLEQEHTTSDLRGMRGTFICGCIFSFLAIMNSFNTIVTITEKRQHEARKVQQRKRAG
eukprot:GHRR01033930.1.p1 GENE.GHRR01033930.1~~GHRR01033930.1.p1  ORF type:complete len:129 (+),score=35.65 GHRR01033930.1:173-559(+)